MSNTTQKITLAVITAIVFFGGTMIDTQKDDYMVDCTINHKVTFKIPRSDCKHEITAEYPNEIVYAYLKDK